eukprot:5024346-Alexandrium_andersonii.AAC.1
MGHAVKVVDPGGPRGERRERAQVVQKPQDACASQELSLVGLGEQRCPCLSVRGVGAAGQHAANVGVRHDGHSPQGTPLSGRT